MRTFIQNFLARLRTTWLTAWRTETGAFSITNKIFATRDAAWIPAAHAELADLTLATASSTVTSATQNTGIVGLKWIRARAKLKTLGNLAAGETLTMQIQAGTGAAITSPVQIASAYTIMLTGDTGILLEAIGWSDAGFQSYAVTLSSSGTSRTSVIDVIVDCA